MGFGRIVRVCKEGQLLDACAFTTGLSTTYPPQGLDTRYDFMSVAGPLLPVAPQKALFVATFAPDLQFFGGVQMAREPAGLQTLGSEPAVERVPSRACEHAPPGGG